MFWTSNPTCEIQLAFYWRENESAKSFSELLFKFLWTHKEINVCAVEGFTIQRKEFILNSEFVFKNAD